MTQRIVWTTRQVTSLVNAFVSIIQHDLPDYRLSSSDDRVGVGFINSNIHRAQDLALERDYWRKFFTKKQLVELDEDVSRALWQKQLEEDKRKAALEGFPLESLIEEIARRNQDALLERLMDRIEPVLTKRMQERVDELAREHFKLIEARLKHDPTPVAGEPGKVLPRYVVVGLLHSQVNELRKRFEGKAEIIGVDKDDSRSGTVKAAVHNKIVFVSRFISHSIHEAIKVRAAETIMVNGGVTDFERLITGRLYDYARLQEAGK